MPLHRDQSRGRVDSINLSGALRDVAFAGRVVRTGIFKSAVEGAVFAHRLGLEGDAQADLSVHGGVDKAVYFYPREHYPTWETLLRTGPLPPGSFGENVTSLGWLETDLHVGDVIGAGTAKLQVVQPRSPCFKLQIRFGRSDMTALFYRRGKPGWYASVLEEGSFAAGDEMILLDRALGSVSIAEVWQCNAEDEVDAGVAARLLALELLPAFWKQRVTGDLRRG